MSSHALARASLTACLAGLTLAVCAPAGHGATYLHNGTTAGNLLPAGTAVSSGGNGPAVITLSGLGTIDCTNNSFIGTVSASGGATAGGTLNALSFTSCTDTLPVITITGCNGVSPAPTVTITATNHNGGSWAWGNLFFRCNVAMSTRKCYYKASTAAGSFVNSGAGLSFSGVAIAHNAPSGTSDDLGAGCGSIGFLDATFRDVRATTSGTTVLLNQTP
jgi:hypothetical protein